MNLAEAGRLRDLWKEKNGEKVCRHARMVVYLTTATGKRKKGKLVCQECGEIFLEKGSPKLKKG